MPQWTLIAKKIIDNLAEIKVNSDWSQFERVVEKVDKVGNRKQLKLLKYREAEHQLSRYLNYRNIGIDLEKFGGHGDVIKFGTYQGLGLILLAKALGNNTPRKFVGIDAFEGLPEASNGWQKGQFSNTTIELCKSNILRHLDSAHDLELIKSWFVDSNLQRKLLGSVQNVRVIHFDCDLGSSLTTALLTSEPYLTNNKLVYLVFDDWGCHADEIPDSFYSWYTAFFEKTGVVLKKYSSTKLTRTYVIDYR